MNFWMRFLETVSSLETYGPLARRILLRQTFMWEAAKSQVSRNRPLTLNELKTAITAYIRTSHKQICRKCLLIKLNGFRPVSTLVDITSNTFYKCTATFRTHCIRPKKLCSTFSKIKPRRTFHNTMIYDAKLLAHWPISSCGTPLVDCPGLHSAHLQIPTIADYLLLSQSEDVPRTPT
jgi:hypothetical protein